ncbi:30S ribosomal protein S13 [Candidatus Falkowbacteria bacterium CG10_big_fil_rev_8_21_14_0_10_37_6]|uniref:Small ribosomal subunit protein uS13 n=1 Tax=Candidatus Falkowbacteria bacterium CG10_big_fil_rev_8_21_14_0_10_37_6 TaxID=1974563 RepID=A0A2H0V6Y5_9BACT|nr:MAG: 30S ribosomal protein S13 [Candidatus Falkowbacteria bacterium CG10_big_fil_rev_8_21_14_0_10_37_6]
MAVRIAGTTIPNEKRVEIALTYIFGIGQTSAKEILTKLEIDPNSRVHELKEDDINKLRVTIEKQYRVEGDLRRDIMANIKRLKEIGCYRGLRHTKGLPARGQRTKTNSRTVRGNTRKTASSGKKMSAQKT